MQTVETYGATLDGVHVAGLSKTFASTRVLRDVTVGFRHGSIHGVVGENGAGKSTLFKILSGYHAPDAGAQLHVDGTEHRFPLTPRTAAALGFAFVHQDLALAESLTVMENVCVGAMPTSLGRIRWRKQARIVDDLMHSLGVNVSARREVRTLSQAEKAVVAIARGSYARGRGHASLLVLDEPTANLTAGERDRLFDAMRRAADQGSAVVFCTHRLDEVLMITDEVTVLRDGIVVARRQTASLESETQLIRDILGRDLEAFYPGRVEHGGNETILRVEDLAGADVRGVDFELNAGEVLGITGFAGSGQDTLPNLLVGAVPASRGTVTVGGSNRTRLTPRTASALGIGYLPADRKRTSGLLSASVRENLTLVSLGAFSRHGRIDKRSERRQVETQLERFDVRPRTASESTLASLSGGNQQKVLLAKWLTKPNLRCMIMHEPTQGVDVGAKRGILEIIAQLSREGVAVLLVSSEHEELSHLCDRVLVMRDGRVRASLSRPNAHQISTQCFVA